MRKEERSTKLFPLEDAASQELGGISVWYLRKGIAQGIIRPTRLGTRIFLSGDEIARIVPKDVSCWFTAIPKETGHHPVRSSWLWHKAPNLILLTICVPR